MAGEGGLSCWGQTTTFTFHVCSPRLETYISQKLLQWAQAGIPLLVTGPLQHWQDHATLVTHPQLQGSLTLHWLGQRMLKLVCKTPLYVLSLALERPLQAEPWHKQQQKVKDVPYLDRGSDEE